MAESDHSHTATRSALPEYLRRTISAVLSEISGPGLADFAQTPSEYLTLEHIKGLHDRKLQYAYLLLARHLCTERLKGFGAELRSRADGQRDVHGEGQSDGSDDIDEDDDEDVEVDGISPELILDRAEIYEALGYADLALADAYVAYTLLLVAWDGSSDSDLVPVTRDGERLRQIHGHETNPEDLDENADEGVVMNDNDNQAAGEDDQDETESYNDSEWSSTNPWRHRDWVMDAIAQALGLLCRSALILGCDSQAKIWFDKLVNRGFLYEIESGDESYEELAGKRLRKLIVKVDLFKDFWCVFHVDMKDLDKRLDRLALSKFERSDSVTFPLFGWSQRQIYPWNEHEPDRMGQEALRDINERLAIAAPALEARLSTLPALAPPVKTANAGEGDIACDEKWTQLGLYANKDLEPGSTILEERSMLTAIRPHGEALCDACAADMEPIPATDRRYCGGCNLPFCSEECHTVATARYHAPNEQDEETEEGYPPETCPFCPGTVGNDDIHILGRAESSTTPEWDLYFLLLSRTLQMAETQETYPLDLFEIKYLWGDFSPTPDVNNLNKDLEGKGTLPFSVRHHIELPLQWFEILMHSRPECRPYSATWLEKYDWWAVQTLFAKFRGVADAQQSTWTGKPEVAAVHPLWCLANHSCNPNVTWKPSGVRNLTVVTQRVWNTALEDTTKSETGDSAWSGIKQGDEIWNHYTDINEKDYRERRARLQAVLGGDCLCERCTSEANR
ncbi:hypothetical protein LTR84_002216 [Exophiala bonariae]|uniref:SET domain-containing protein n=1 Tax=Exophiala bonariae TaxID=1690606 RepID=A0AAV9NCZ7_9EURO|nr:hypothetical protein LTR84_002216 [Exophiala bonariae]